MTITCTKMEFARLIRWCEGTKLAGDCGECPFFQCGGKDDENGGLADMCQIAALDCPCK